MEYVNLGRSDKDMQKFYDEGGRANPLLDHRVRPLGLSVDERADLVAYDDDVFPPGVEDRRADRHGAVAARVGRAFDHARGAGHRDHDLDGFGGSHHREEERMRVQREDEVRREAPAA